MLSLRITNYFFPLIQMKLRTFEISVNSKLMTSLNHGIAGNYRKYFYLFECAVEIIGSRQRKDGSTEIKSFGTCSLLRKKLVELN